MIDGDLNDCRAQLPIAAHRLDGEGIPEHSWNDSAGSRDVEGVGFPRFDFSDLSNRDLFLLGGGSDDRDVEFCTFGDRDLADMFLAEWASHDEGSRRNLQNLEQIASDVQSQSGSLGVIATDSGVFSDRFCS